MKCGECSCVNKSSIFGSVGFCEKYFKEVRLDSWVECVGDRITSRNNENIAIEQEPAQATKQKKRMAHKNFIKSLTQEQRQWIYDNYKPELSKKAIADKLGCCLATVHNNIQKIEQMSKWGQSKKPLKESFEKIEERSFISTTKPAKENPQPIKIPAGWEEYRKNLAKDIYMEILRQKRELTPETPEIAVKYADLLILQLTK